MTVKNYKAMNGLSTQLFNAVAEEDILASARVPTMSDKGLLEVDGEDFSPKKKGVGFDWTTPKRSEPRRIIA